MSRLRAVGLYHDLDFKDHQQEFSTLFELLLPAEEMPHMPIEDNKIFITPVIEKLMQNYDTLHNLPTAQMDEGELSLENASPAAIPHLEQKTEVPTRINSRQSNKTTKE